MDPFLIDVKVFGGILGPLLCVSSIFYSLSMLYMFALLRTVDCLISIWKISTHGATSLFYSISSHSNLVSRFYLLVVPCLLKKNAIFVVCFDWNLKRNCINYRSLQSI